MLRKVISGGQTGVDMAAIQAARQCGLETGGWAPRGWLTEAGPAVERLRSCGLQECPYGEDVASAYRFRTEANVSSSDATLWIGTTTSRGYGATEWAVDQQQKRLKVVPWIGVRTPASVYASRVASWIDFGRIHVLNVAGHRESVAPGIGAWALEFLTAVFTLLGHEAGQVASEGEPR